VAVDRPPGREAREAPRRLLARAPADGGVGQDDIADDRNAADTVIDGLAGSVAVTVTVCGAIVRTNGAVTVVVKLPAASDVAAPLAPPLMETGWPGTHCVPTSGMGWPDTKQAPWGASVAAPAAAGAASAAVAASAAANGTFISGDLPCMNAVERLAPLARGQRLHTPGPDR
jgi:hypothetical protein